MDEIHIHDVLDAVQDVLDWQHLVEPWAADEIRRAMGQVVEQRRQDPGSDRDDVLLLPPYAVSRVRKAVRHARSVSNRAERDLLRFQPPRRKGARVAVS